MEVMIGVIGLIIGTIAAVFSGFSVRIMRGQLRAANEQLLVMRQQAALPQPSSSSYGLRASNLLFADSILGKYEGKSGRHKLTRGSQSLEYNHIEQFTIDRSDDRITIAGRSLDLNTYELISHWSGGLWKVGEDSTLHFGLELNHLGSMEFGTLTVAIHGEVAEGHYYSGAPMTQFVNKYTAKRVTEFSANDPHPALVS